MSSCVPRKLNSYVLIAWPELTSKIFAVLSPPPVRTRVLSALHESEKMEPLWAVAPLLRGPLGCPVLPSYMTILESDPPLRSRLPSGENRMQFTNLVCSLVECLNLSGRFSYQLSFMSSPDVAILYGFGPGWKSHVVSFLEWPTMSPAWLPLSQLNTCPNEPLPSPTATIFCPSDVHARSRIAPATGRCSSFTACSGSFAAQTFRLPTLSAETTQLPSGENLATVAGCVWA
mmetsp:Transcript_22944/g.39327  ORF Transcript_22944/g.39327 Transcript_22944/m.39327 type:complete len:231 (-) Transcript_22944:272-964(-)